MPRNKPSLIELKDRILSRMDANISGLNARLPRSFTEVLAFAIAALGYGVYGFIEWVGKQAFLVSAEAEILDSNFGAVYGINRIAPSKAIGTVTFLGSSGAVVPANTLVQRADGLQYKTLLDGTVSAGTVTISAESVLPGLNTNTGSGTVLALVNPLRNIQSNATAATNFTGGADIEKYESYRQRIIEFVQAPTRGGSAEDYSFWAKVANVTRVFVTQAGAGDDRVTVRFMMDNTYSDGIPLSGDVAAVAAYIETVRPLQGNYLVQAPTATPLAFTIQLSPNTAEVQAAVTAQLRDLIRRDCTPGGTLLISRIREAVSIAAGEADHAITTPTANVTTTAPAITTLGAITFSSL
jgi:uncharacterized phage protein gp47/JayE